MRCRPRRGLNRGRGWLRQGLGLLGDGVERLVVVVLERLAHLTHKVCVLRLRDAACLSELTQLGVRLNFARLDLDRQGSVWLALDECVLRGRAACGVFLLCLRNSLRLLFQKRLTFEVLPTSLDGTGVQHGRVVSVCAGDFSRTSDQHGISQAWNAWNRRDTKRRTFPSSGNNRIINGTHKARRVHNVVRSWRGSARRSGPVGGEVS